MVDRTKQNMRICHLLPFITVIADKEVVFQQVNAIVTKEWFENF